MFDKAVKEEQLGKKPVLPIWLTPTQVRILPLSNEYLKLADGIMKKIEAENIRVDIDDREETLDKKIRDAETRWIHYIIVIGPKELNKKSFPVRIRGKKTSKQMSINELIEDIRIEIGSHPFKALPIPRFLSDRPGYR